MKGLAREREGQERKMEGREVGRKRGREGEEREGRKKKLHWNEK